MGTKRGVLGEETGEVAAELVGVGRKNRRSGVVH